MTYIQNQCLGCTSWDCSVNGCIKHRSGPISYPPANPNNLALGDLVTRIVALESSYSDLYDKHTKLKNELTELRHKVVARPTENTPPKPKPRHRIKLTISYRGKFGSITYDYVTKDWTGSISIDGVKSYSTRSTVDPVIQDLEEYVDKALDKP